MHTGAEVAAGVHIANTRKERLAVFVRGSSIIPMQSLVQSTKEKAKNIIELHIYKGPADNSYCYYEDDGQTYKYEKGDSYKRIISYSPAHKHIQLAKPEGSFHSHFKHVKLYLHGFEATHSFKINGKSLNSSTEDYQFIAPVSLFDPFYTEQPADLVNKQVPFVQFENSDHAITINW
jgi:alpha-glucosidase